MNTQNITPAGNNNSKGNTAAKVATTAAAAAVGAAGAYAAEHLFTNEEPAAEVKPEETEAKTQEKEAAQAQPAKAETESHETAAAATTAEPAHNEAGKEHSGEVVEPVVTVHPAPGPVVVEPGPNDGPTPDVVVEPDPMDDPARPVVDESKPEDGLTNEIDEPVTEEVVNPDLVADNIIGATHIDPNDNDTATILDVKEMGVVYTIDGDVYDAVHVQDINGTDLVLVDLDGDGTLDVITDMDCNLITDANGAPIVVDGLTIDDAQYALHTETTDSGYLAANDQVEEPSIDPADDMLA